MNRKCIVQRVSDLVSRYVGETEQAIAKVFREAEQNGDVIVFDEADYFLYARETATRTAALLERDLNSGHEE